MSVNFPTDRTEAGLGSGPLQQGDSWRFGSIEYTWVITPDRTGIWSSKGINVNPDIYIAKGDLFQDNGGVISGSYNGGANKFAVSYAAEAGDAGTLGGQSSSYYRNADNINSGTLNKARLPTEIDSDTTGSAAELGNQLPSHYLDCANFTGTLNKDRLPTEIDSNTTGNAVTADTADQVANPLTINFYAPGLTPGVDNPTNSVVYDGSQTGDNAIINITDTDSATAIIDVIAGDGLSEPSDNTLTVNNTVVRTGTGTSAGYAVSGTGDTRTNKLKSGDSDKLGGEDPSYYLDYDNIPNAPTIPENTDTTYSAAPNGGISIDNSNQISVNTSVARTNSSQPTVQTGSYVVNQNNQGLRVFTADRATSDENGLNLVNETELTNAINAIPGAGTPSLDDVLVEGNTSNTNIEIFTADRRTTISPDGVLANQYLFNETGNDTGFRSGGDNVVEFVSASNLVNTTFGPFNVSYAVPIIDRFGNEVQGVDPAFFGADVLWTDEDALGSMSNADDTRFQAFVNGVNNNTFNSMFVPGGINIVLTQPYVINRKFGIHGPASSLGKDMGRITFNHSSSIGLHCTKGIRAENFQFFGSGKTESDPASPTTLIFVGTNVGSNNDPNVDSSFKSCQFDSKRGGYFVRINGRNVNIGDCAFSDLSNGGVCIKLLWNNIAAGGGDQDPGTSWRKNRIYDNQFHTQGPVGGNPPTVAIELEGDNQIGGLIISNNIFDIGNLAFVVKSGGLNGCAFTGNTWYGRNQGAEGVIRLEAGTIRNFAITGNTFSGHRDGAGTPNNFIKSLAVVNVRGMAITGNGFSYCDNEAISIDDSNDASRTTVVGNTFVAVNGGGAPFTNGCEEAANIITTL